MDNSEEIAKKLCAVGEAYGISLHAPISKVIRVPYKEAAAYWHKYPEVGDIALNCNMDFPDWVIETFGWDNRKKIDKCDEFYYSYFNIMRRCGYDAANGWAHLHGNDEFTYEDIPYCLLNGMGQCEIFCPNYGKDCECKIIKYEKIFKYYEPRIPTDI